MKTYTIIGIGLLVPTLFWTSANATTITSNDITGQNPGLQNPYTTGLNVNPNITASGIGHGTGVTGRTGNDRYNAKKWSTGGLNVDDYFTFTLEANNGYELNFTSVTYASTVSNTGPAEFAFRSNLDSFTTDIGSPTPTGATIDLSATQFQHLTDPIEFRLYGYSASGNAGTFSVNNYQFEGDVTATPEPQTIALIGIGASLLLLYRRQTRLGDIA